MGKHNKGKRHKKLLPLPLDGLHPFQGGPALAVLADGSEVSGYLADIRVGGEREKKWKGKRGELRRMR